VWILIRRGKFGTWILIRRGIVVDGDGGGLVHTIPNPSISNETKKKKPYKKR
jgi:hypothetical protein